MNDQTQTSEPAVYGREATLRTAGYTPLPEKPKDAAPLTVEDAADILTLSKPESAEPLTLEPLPANVAITVEQAAENLSEAHKAQRAAADELSTKNIATYVDRIRAEEIGKHGDVDGAADFYGVPKPEGEPAQEGAPADDGRLDPNIEEVLKHPQVRQAIEEQLSAADEAKQAYSAALSTAASVAQATLFAQFPEFANLTAEQIPVALQMLAQQNPERFAKVNGFIGQVATLHAQQQAEQQRQTEQAQRQFNEYAKAEDARFDAMLAKEPPGKKETMAAEILKAAEEHGIPKARFLHLMQTEPVMRHAAFQKMMYDAAKYRALMNNPPKPSAKPIPSLQRPGVTQPKGASAYAAVAAAEEKFQRTRSPRDAAAHLRAKRAAGML